MQQMEKNMQQPQMRESVEMMSNAPAPAKRGERKKRGVTLQEDGPRVESGSDASALAAALEQKLQQPNMREAVETTSSAPAKRGERKKRQG